MAKLRILLGDDHILVRQGIGKSWRSEPDWEVVAEASDGRDAVRQAEPLTHTWRFWISACRCSTASKLLGRSFVTLPMFTS